MQNVRHSFQSEKFLHHCVQRVANARNKKNFFWGENFYGFPFFVFWEFYQKTGFLDFFQLK
jgi:hypothetical protein